MVLPQLVLNAATSVEAVEVSPAVVRVVDWLRRDLRAVFGVPTGEASGALVRVCAPTGEGEPETWRWVLPPQEPNLIEVQGTDDLGLIYGLLALSRHLGVEPFWFWNDQPPARRSSVAVTGPVTSTPARVRFRGWFVNDEVCLIGMSPVYPPSLEIGEAVFEALLRTGGNLVIPGTDLPRSGGHWELASAMGLWTTNHHAEPLGAEMFSRAYPGVPARYDLQSARFEHLWEEAVVRGRDRSVVWVLGFRGQGDMPFWHQDPAYREPAERGRLIRLVIEKQLEILRRHVPDAAYCSYIYGEITELYRDGHLEFPEETIKIWSDNGFGRMVSRRQENWNPRLPSRPGPSDRGPHGLYYHVTFHDLQASNHLTMFPGPTDLIRSELEGAFEAGADRFLLVNCGNVRPHVFFLELVAELWSRGTVVTDTFLDAYCQRAFPSASPEVARLFRSWPEATVKYGPHEDDRAGEELFYHASRSLVGCWMVHRGAATDVRLHWATGPVGFQAQLAWFEARLAEALPRWTSLDQQSDDLLARLNAPDRDRWRLTLVPQIRLQAEGCRGLWQLCRSFIAAERSDLPRAFVLASEAVWAFERAQATLEQVEVGPWKGFYRCDYLTNVRATLTSVKTFRGVLRQLGDSPNLFSWSRKYLIPESERGAMLENTTRRVLDDDELARGLAALRPDWK